MAKLEGRLWCRFGSVVGYYHRKFCESHHGNGSTLVKCCHQFETGVQILPPEKIPTNNSRLK